jgi:hypothetical protein
MASMHSRAVQSHNPKLHMLAGPLGAILLLVVKQLSFSANELS